MGKLQRVQLWQPITQTGPSSELPGRFFVVYFHNLKKWHITKGFPGVLSRAWGWGCLVYDVDRVILLQVIRSFPSDLLLFETFFFRVKEVQKNL